MQKKKFNVIALQDSAYTKCVCKAKAIKLNYIKYSKNYKKNNIAWLEVQKNDM